MVKSRSIYLLIFALLIMISFCLYFLLNSESKSNIRLITEHLPDVEFNTSNLVTTKINNETILWLDGIQGNSKKMYCFVILDNKVNSVQSFDQFASKENPLEWSRSVRQSRYSIVSGVFDPNYIDSVTIDGIPHDTIHYLNYGDLKVFFSIEFFDKDPVKISGMKNGSIVYKNYP